MNLQTTVNKNMPIHNINKHKFKKAFLKGAGSYTNRKNITDYFKHVFPVWDTDLWTCRYNNSELVQLFGFVEGQLHQVRMSVYGENTPNWLLIAQAARKTIPVKFDTAQLFATALKEQLDECETACGSISKSAIANGIMWTLVHNHNFAKEHPRFALTVEKKLNEFIETPSIGLNAEGNLHNNLQFRTYRQMIFHNLLAYYSNEEIMVQCDADITHAPSGPSKGSKQEVCGTLMTRSGRISRPPSRLMH
jgi:hypothetical protein